MQYNHKSPAMTIPTRRKFRLSWFPFILFFFFSHTTMIQSFTSTTQRRRAPVSSSPPPSITGTSSDSSLSAASTISGPEWEQLNDEISIGEDHDNNKSLFRQLNVVTTNAAVPRPWVVGHRGALYDKLENTRSSFQYCADIGCDAIELDVFWLPKDNSLIVFHGAGNDRDPGKLMEYCGRPGTILDLSYAEACELQFNVQNREFPCPPQEIRAGKIPTLEEVLRDAKQSGIKVKIELKGPNTAVPTLDLVDRLDMVDQCSFSCFDLARLDQVRRLRPQKKRNGRHVYQTGALFDHYDPVVDLPRAQAVGVDEIHLRYDSCSVDHIAQIHAAGLASMAWFRGPVGMARDTSTKYLDVGNEDTACYQAVLRSGVQQMCVNKPGLLISMLQQQGGRPRRPSVLASATERIPSSSVPVF